MLYPTECLGDSSDSPYHKRESWISIVAIDQLHNLCLPNFYSINIKSIHEIFIRADRIFYQKSSDFSLFTIKTINYRQIKQTVFPLLPFNFHLSIRANEGIPSSSSLRLLQIKNFENKIYTSTELPSFNSSIIHTSLLPRPTQKFHSLSRMNRSSFPPSLPPGNPHRPSSTRKETKETNPLPSPHPKQETKFTPSLLLPLSYSNLLSDRRRSLLFPILSSDSTPKQGRVERGRVDIVK